MDHIETNHGRLDLPAFLPDATRGVVRAVDAGDTRACGVTACMVNTLHLSHQPGTGRIQQVGGIHRFMGWDGPVASDSGGFQVYSLATQSPDLVRLSKDGFSYRRTKDDRKHLLTPEKCIQKQFELGSDIMFCLDHCTHPDEPEDTQRRSVQITVEWSRRCRQEFDRRVQRWPAERRPPLLFAVVQGGGSPDLRRACIDQLLQVGFDGYGYGGWPIGKGGQLVDMVELVARGLPPGALKHGLGIGKPENVVKAHAAGYQLFDCVLPTRDARRGRLSVFSPEPCRSTIVAADPFYHYVYIQDEQHGHDDRPVDDGCDCLTCRRYSRAYLNHLFIAKDPVAYRLATMHNLRFYARLMELLATTGDSL